LNPDCGAVFSTGESADYEKTWVVQYPGGTLFPFLRDKLLLSIYKACQHRPSALEDAIGLTDTVMNAVRKDAREAFLPVGTLAKATHTVLKRFDQPAAISYQAFHADVL
jgi:transcriptional regulator NrdR family protein